MESVLYGLSNFSIYLENWWRKVTWYEKICHVTYTKINKKGQILKKMTFFRTKMELISMKCWKYLSKWLRTLQRTRLLILLSLLGSSNVEISMHGHWRVLAEKCLHTFWKVKNERLLEVMVIFMPFTTLTSSFGAREGKMSCFFSTGINHNTPPLFNPPFPHSIHKKKKNALKIKRKNWFEMLLQLWFCCILEIEI